MAESWRKVGGNNAGICDIIVLPITAIPKLLSVLLCKHQSKGRDCGIYTAAEIQKLIDTGCEHEFYASYAWQKKAAAIKRRDRYECQLCKKRGRYRRGEIVHHVKHLKDRPDLAMTETDPDTGERQLITVCKACHEKEHPESLNKAAKEDAERYTNREMWE